MGTSGSGVVLALGLQGLPSGPGCLVRMQARGGVWTQGPGLLGNRPRFPEKGLNLPVRVWGAGSGFRPGFALVPGRDAGPRGASRPIVWRSCVNVHCFHSSPVWAALRKCTILWRSGRRSWDPGQPRCAVSTAGLARRGRADEVRLGLWAGGSGWSTARFRSGAGGPRGCPGSPLGVNSPYSL